MKKTFNRNGFTLVELLTVLAVISIVAGMTVAAISSVTNTAKLSRTRGIIAVIDDVLMSKYESYKTRPLPVTVPTSIYDANNEVSIEVPPEESARVRLNMIRDLMRMEMPDRKIDVVDPPAALTAAARRVQFLYDNTLNRYRYQREPTLTKRQVQWYGGTSDIPAQLAVYRGRYPDGDVTKWTRQFESAEALYLVISTSFLDGLPAIESIPQSNIGDVDQDGMLEILDGWGTPIGYVRWPVDYISGLGFSKTNDEFDPFETDFGHFATNAPIVATGETRLAPFSMRPLVISAGADGVFDTRFGYGTSEDGSDDIRFSQMTWPSTQMGNRSQGHGAPYIFVDPYQRHTGASVRLGGYFDENNDGDEQRADNITNYALETAI